MIMIVKLNCLKIDDQYWEHIHVNAFVWIKAKYLYIMYICMYFLLLLTENNKSCGYNNWYYMIKLSFENYEINFVYYFDSD